MNTLKTKPKRGGKSARGKDMSNISDRSLREFVGYSMKRCYMTIQSDLLSVLEEFELRPSTFSALLLICDNPDMTQTQLAGALNIERSGVVLIVDELENRELISRNKVPTDRRSYALRATLAGVRLRDQAHARVVEHERQLLKGLNDEQQAQLITLLQLIESGAKD